jgi:hypothetical protein
MDAMPKIMIVLAAVVLLILVIGFLAMRFLRPDDSDPFEDAPAEPAPGRRAADDDLPRARKQPARTAADRRPAAEPERQLVRAGRGLDDRADARTGAPFADRPDRPSDSRSRAAERADRADTGRSSGDRAARPPAAKPRPASSQAGYRDRGSEPRPASRDDSGAQQRRPAAPPVARGPAKPARRNGAEAQVDWESMSDVDYWAELAADKPLTGDEPTAAIPAMAAKPAQRRAPADGRPPAGAPDRPEPGPTAKLPVRPRPQQNGAGAPAGHGNSGQHARPADSGPHLRPGDSGQNRRPGDSGQNRRPADLPSRRPRTGDYPVQQPASAQPSLAALARLADSSPAPTFDDDPLTSPSFPAIVTSDSRSYRSRRSSSADRSRTGSRTPPPPAAPPVQPPSAYPPAAQYGDAGYAPSASGATWQPDYAGGTGPQPVGYQGQRDSMPPAASLPPAMPPASESYRNHPSLPLPTGQTALPSAVSQPMSQQVSQPAGNPYGSYVTDAPAGYQQQPAAAPAPAYQGSYQQYEQPAPQNGYLPAGGQYGSGQYYHGDPSTYGDNGYQPGLDQAGYPQPGYQPTVSQNGYSQDQVYGFDASGYPGYGAGGR